MSENEITAAIDAKVAESDFTADADERHHLARVIRPWTMCDDGGRFDHGSDRAAAAVLAAGYSRTPDAHLAAAKAEALEEAADAWTEWEVYEDADGARSIRRRDVPLPSWLRARAARLREQASK